MQDVLSLCLLTGGQRDRLVLLLAFLKLTSFADERQEFLPVLVRRSAQAGLCQIKHLIEI